MKVITIAGKIGRDAELKTVGKDSVASFSVAVDERGRGGENTTIWFDCSMWGKRGEALAPHLVKGQAVSVSGDFTVRSYTAKDGTPKTAFGVRVNDVALQGKKPDGAGRKEESGGDFGDGGGGDFGDDNEIPF